MSRRRSDRAKVKVRKRFQDEVVDTTHKVENSGGWTKLLQWAFIVLVVSCGFAYAYLLTDLFESPKEGGNVASGGSRASGRTVRKNLPRDFDLPPQNTPADRGYNAASGQFPPGALPSGVNLPGIQSYNSTIQGRSLDQGYEVNDGIRQKFTGQIRDNETGLDYFNARYYAPRHGRFTSVDPENAGADPADPQSWNAYAYARNNPLKYTDPSGEEYLICDKDGKCWKHYDSDVKNAKGAGGFFWIGSKSEKTGFDSGNIYDDDGNITATYQQISHDDQTQAMLWGANPTLTLWQPLIELVQPAPIPGGGAVGGITKVGKAAKIAKAGRTAAKGFRVIERVGDVIHIAVRTAKGEVEVIANIAKEGERLILKGVHVQGSGANSLGLRELRGLERAFAQEIGKHEGVKEVVIHGGKRTSGANPGRMPAPRTFKID